MIAKVDCEAPNAKATAEKAGVKSYPTINYYPKGSTEAVPYTGGRSESDLIAFMNEQAGTHRAVGGGLDAIAGTIPSLDEILGSIQAGGNKAYAELGTAAAALGDKSGEYYAKVAKKMDENSEYASKEAARLQGIIKKGGLSSEKLDDVVRRNNVLSRFIADVEGKSEL